MREGGFCAILIQAARNSLILNGEMSEWSIEHAWKLNPPARADAHQIPPTHFRSTTSRNNNVHRSVPLNHRVCPGFQGVCDTVLTQGVIQLGGTCLRRRGTMARDLTALCEAHSFHQRAKARLVMEVLPRRLDVEKHHHRIARLERSLEPRDGL